ncbi:MAG: hypothetical protein KC613_11125, partial [Myxococcales bacterium]|nr:hypothetical protein [Myxococcales bacterium]
MRASTVQGVAYVAALCVFGGPLAATAAGPAPPGPAFLDWLDRNDREAEPEPREFRLINYFFARGTFTNMLADPSGLRGVSLGPLGPGAGVGSSTAVRDDTEAAYVEQRWIPVLEFHPRFADGFAAFRAQFEVDYTWGDASNLIQNNQGGGFNADQVNIQTKNVNVALYPTRVPKQASILIGTQSVYDTIYDPTITPLSTIVQTGYKLAFMGTDATGISAFANTDWGLGKLSFIPLGAAQPLRATEQDPSFFYARLFTADYAFRVQPETVVGLTYWYLADETRGRAQSFTAVPRGPKMAFVGTRPAAVNNPSGAVHYLGAHFHHNLHFGTGPLAASGFFMFNTG